MNSLTDSSFHIRRTLIYCLHIIRRFGYPILNGLKYKTLTELENIYMHTFANSEAQLTYIALQLLLEIQLLIPSGSTLHLFQIMNDRLNKSDRLLFCMLTHEVDVLNTKYQVTYPTAIDSDIKTLMSDFIYL